MSYFVIIRIQSKHLMSKQHATKRRLATDSKQQVTEANDSNAFDSM